MPQTLPMQAQDEPVIRTWPLNFQARLEDRYRRESIEHQYRLVAVGWLIGLGMYDLFVASDYMLAGDGFQTYVAIRFLFVTPVCLFLIWRIWRRSSHYDLLVGLIPTTMIIGLSAALIMTDGDYRTHYLFGNILLMVCGGVVGRPRTQFVAVMASLQFACYVTVLQTTDFVPGPSKLVCILFCLSGAMASILTAYASEKSMRHSFLLGLRVQQLNDELNIQALTDPLTGLANRRSFERATDRHWRTQAAELRPVAIVLLDVDLFKIFNDSYGHSAGDVCLKRIAGRVAAACPGTGALAVRFGGEEILLFLPGIDLSEARGIAERIRRSIEDEAIPHPAVKLGSVVTASLGVAAATPASCSVSDLIAAADAALYAAKANGRNQVCPPLSGMGSLAVSREGGTPAAAAR